MSTGLLGTTDRTTWQLLQPCVLAPANPRRTMRGLLDGVELR